MGETLDKPKNSRDTVEKLTLVAEAAHMLNSTLEYEEVLASVLKLLGRAVNAEGAMVYRFEEARNELHGRFHYGDQKPRRVVFRVGQGFVGWAAQHGQPVISNNPLEDERYYPAFQETEDFKLKSILCYPLNLRGRFIGVIEAVNARSGEFCQLDLDKFELLADPIAVAVNNAQLYRKARREALERKTLFDVSRNLMTSLNVDEVLHSILLALKNVVEFDAGGVYLIKEGSPDVDSITSLGYDRVLEADLHVKVGQGIVGDVARTGQAQIVGDVAKDSRYINTRLETRSEIVVPIQLNGKIVGILNLESDRLDAFTDADRDALLTFASPAALAIERAQMHRYILEQKKIEQQLSIARTIQKTFLPNSVPRAAGFDLWGTNLPSGEVGGDYYDFISIVENQLGIAIADVSGKGIPAALIMASFRASLIAEIRNNYAIRSICRKVNDLLCESLEPENFVTAIYGVLDTKNSIFTFCNCGHNPGLLIRADNRVEELTEGGIILGIRSGANYEERPIYINSGDLLCLFTDGVIEAENGVGEQFEIGRLVELLKKKRDLPAAEIGARIMGTVHSYARPGFVMDDLTLIVIKRL